METLLLLGAAAAALTAIGVAGIKLIRSIRAGVDAAKEFFKVQAAASRVINAEMTTNDGGSLLDKVNKIKSNHETAEKHWKALREQQEAMLERIVNVEEAVVQHGIVPCIALNELKRQLEARG